MEISTTLTAVVPPKPIDATPGAGDGTENIADLGQAIKDATPQKDAGGEKEGAKADDKHEDKTEPWVKARISRGIAKGLEQTNARIASLEEQNAKLLENLERIFPAKQIPEDRPQREAFDDPDAYVEALSDWKAQKQVKLARAQEYEKAVKQRGETLVQAHKRREEEARERYDDFDEVVSGAGSVTHLAQAAILRSDVSAEVQYYLGAHPKELAKLNEMDDAIDAGRYIGKIEEKIAAKPAGKEVTKAPAPIKPVGGNGSVPRNKNDPNISPEEFFAAIDAEHAARVAALKSGAL